MKDATYKLIATIISEMIFKFISYKHLGDRLIEVGKELVKVNGPQTIIFGKHLGLYTVQRINFVAKAASNKHVIYGEWGFNSKFGRITSFTS